VLHRKFIVAALWLSISGLSGLGQARAADVGAVLDDSVITTKIKADLLGDPTTKAHQIKVKTYHGVVQLSGFVDSAAAESRAVDIAHAVDGVKEVSNRLTLRVGDNTPGQVIDNSILTTKVKAALVGNPDTKAREIKVTSQGDVVKLSGFVGSTAEKEEAYKVASQVDGVRDVRNDIQVKTD
jgi:hyperosmotically inducible protein